jgi:AraC-like DNA-binding protein
MRTVEQQTYFIDDKLSIDGEGASPFVFCAGWLLEIIEIESGEFYFLSDSQPVKPKGKRFGVFYPSFTIVRSFVKNLRGTVRGVGRVEPLDGSPAKPIIFDTGLKDKFTSANQVADVIKSARHKRSIEMNTDPSILSLRVKRLIDENYAVYPSTARIAERLKVSHAHLSRQFKKDFKMSPSEYLHHLRTADAQFRLSLGQEIVDISMEVGYNDLSRFYRQFKKKTATSPAACRAILENET